MQTIWCRGLNGVNVEEVEGAYDCKLTMSSGNVLFCVCGMGKVGMVDWVCPVRCS